MRGSMLFLPGSAPNMIINGGAFRADSVILDLEDAVSPDEKDGARILVRNALKTLDFGCETIVRINSAETEFCSEDLAEIIPCIPGAVMPPKASSAKEMRELDEKISAIEEKCGIPLGTVKVIPLIETALGIENAYEIAASCERVVGILLGGEDLTADLRCKRTKDGEEIRYARGRIVCAARAAGKEVYDTPFTDVYDDEGLTSDAEFAKSLGFSGKAAIAPRHIFEINRVFSPSEAEILYAKEVMEAIAEGKRLGRGAVSLRGKMIDAPIAARAKQTLEAASQLKKGGTRNG